MQQAAADNPVLAPSARNANNKFEPGQQKKDNQGRDSNRHHPTALDIALQELP
jgi:hypothetical protein